MVIRITWRRLCASACSKFECTYRANVIDGETVKGLRRRWLVQDSGDKETGFAMSPSSNLRIGWRLPGPITTPSPDLVFHVGGAAARA